MTATRNTLDRIAERYIPPASVEHTHQHGVCYTQDTTRGPAQRPYFTVIAYAGTGAKKVFYEGYGTAEARDKRMAEFFKGLDERNAMRSEHKAESSKPHTVKVGDIIHHSWGWEQTQCDYYQVLAVTAHGATIQAIASEAVPGSEGHMSERQMPVRDHFVRRCGSGPIEEPFKVRINGLNIVTTLEHGCAHLWDGQAKYCSWYG